jgi:hypothetical protein
VIVEVLGPSDEILGVRRISPFSTAFFTRDAILELLYESAIRSVHGEIM